MSNYKTHAMREFQAAGWVSTDGKWSNDMQELMCKQVMELLEMFAEHGHSGSSAPYAIGLFKSLAAFEPLVPLQGADTEWNEVSNGMWQNNRCSHVFKESDGSCYDIQGKVFRDPDGCCYTNRESRVPVVFPYTPKTEYVDREEPK